MPSIRAFAFLLLSIVAAPLLAQQTARPIEQQMTPEQFRAAGLDKLDATELANLNAWLNRTLDVATSKAVVQAKKAVVEESRGFFHFGSEEPIVARIKGEFRGFAEGRSYTLENGQVWKQVDDASLAAVRLASPQVTIKPAKLGNVWFLRVDGYNTRAKVQRVK